MSLEPVQPILVAERFRPLHDRLIDLLESLAPGDWAKPTAAPAWRVKDVAAHLLDTDLRRLSSQRDGHPLPEPEHPIAGYRDLVGFLNELNARWVGAMERVSPRLLIDLLRVTGPQVADFLATLDPDAPAPFGVAWAGEESSPNWFDVAREYTEKWHHQEQIRDAVGAPGLTGRRWLAPVIDTFLRGLPHAYREVEAPANTRVGVTVTGEAGGAWTLERREGAWRLFAGSVRDSAARVELSDDTAWRLFTKGLTPEEATLTIKGDESLGRPLARMLAVMA